MTTILQTQAAKLWSILTDAATLNAYQQTLSITWIILIETARLLWLVLCVVLVGLAWVLGAGFWAGKSFRTWITTIEQPSTEPMLSQFSKGMLTTSKNGVNLALTNAMKQLGMSETPKLIQDVLPKTESETSPSPSLPNEVTKPAPKSAPAAVSEPTPPSPASGQASDQPAADQPTGDE